MAKKKTTVKKSTNNNIQMRRVIFVLAVATVGVIALGISSAAPRSRGSLVVPDGLYGSTTTATLSGASQYSDPWIVANCYQGDSPVIFNRLAFDDNGQAILQLGPTNGWKSGIGGADCTAEAKNWNLKRQRWDTVSSTRFHVND